MRCLQPWARPALCRCAGGWGNRQAYVSHVHGPGPLGLWAQNSSGWVSPEPQRGLTRGGVGLPQLPPQKSRVFWEGFLEETMGRSLAGGRSLGPLPRPSPSGGSRYPPCLSDCPWAGWPGPRLSPHLQVGVLTCCCLLQDWPFDDGAPPPGKVVEDWLSLLKSKFCDDPGSCVAVHCVAGLGR